MGVNRSKWPALVQVGLWGLPNRASAWFFCWLSIALAVASIPAGMLVHPICFAGALLVFAALWYYLSIRWVDQNGSWS